MVRYSKIELYGEYVCKAVNDLFAACKKHMPYKTDVLLCAQNGCWFENSVIIGLGKEGLESLQSLNYIFGPGLETHTHDDDYFKKVRQLNFDGTSPFEVGVREEMHRYLQIWENTFLLRILIELANLANGKPYNWGLDIAATIKRRGGVKSNVIECDILKPFDSVPSFKEVLSIAYNRKIRNAIAHCMYNMVQDGIVVNDMKNPYPTSLYGLTYPEWEKVFLYAYLMQRLIKNGLDTLSKNNALFCQENRCGAPIHVTYKDGTESTCLTYPFFYANMNLPIWRFNVPEWAIPGKSSYDVASFI